MVRSGISVEVCHVLEEGSKTPKRTLIKKEPRVKTEKATPKLKTKKGNKRKRDCYSETDEEEGWTGQSSSGGSQDAWSRKPKRTRKSRDPEPEPTTTRYSSPEL